ncbi:MAG TPA: hypothetical protein VH186_24875 [Chloroflexia bacterium]|nr:hypothetical protein [Chloroflexia bacterium]
MYQSTYYVDKASGTPGDILAAYGLARLLRYILNAPNYYSAKEVKIKDAGDKYVITLPVSLTREMVEKVDFFAPIEFILTAKNATKRPAKTTALDYEKTKADVNTYYERRQNLPMEALKDPLHPAWQNLDPPRPEWATFQAINQMSAIIGYNEIINRWEENEKDFPALFELLLFMTSSSPNQVEEAQAQWNAGIKQGHFKGKSEATASQLFNPASGKGQNSSKSSALAMGNLNNFWLLEFLKAVGAFECAAPRMIRNPKNPRAKDRKLYVLDPRQIDLELNRGIWDEFQTSFRSSTSVLMDIRAALDYTRTFLNRSETMARQIVSLFEDEGGEPENYINGLWSVFYKDLGSSAAVMNISFIGLPGWVRQIDTPEQVQQYLDVIAEHEALLKNLDEGRAEEYDLLLTYRNFLSGHDLEALCDFCAGYSRFYMSVTEREWDRRGRFLRLHTINNLEVIMTNQTKNRNPDLTTIIQDEGFLRVAYALRQSTVIPQRNKARGGDRLYEPKYGLIQELKRKGQYKDEFITALTDFVSSYNLETEQVYENKKGFSNPADAHLRQLQRSRVERSHLDSVMRLVEENGSSLICNLLAAYGSAEDRKTKEERQPEEEQEPAGILK